MGWRRFFGVTSAEETRTSGPAPAAATAAAAAATPSRSTLFADQ
jgi:hypothetical protein